MVDVNCDFGGDRMKKFLEKNTYLTEDTVRMNLLLVLWESLTESFMDS
jgi:hypothetical protein